MTEDREKLICLVKDTINSLVASYEQQISEQRELLFSSESMLLALLKDPAFDHIRLLDLKEKAMKHRERLDKYARAAIVLEFLEYITETSDVGPLVHPVVRLFQKAQVPNREGTALISGSSVLDAAEKWMEQTSYRRPQNARTNR